MVTPARRTHAAAALPPRKPLYLLASTPARMDAGPDHLVLRRDQGAPLRFPLARLWRQCRYRHCRHYSVCRTTPRRVSWGLESRQP